jgi:NHL repeat
MRAALTLLATTLAVAGTAASATSTAGTIVTVAGTGVSGQTGDGGPAIAAQIVHPRGIALAPGGGYVFADAFAQTVRRVWPDGTITTVAGTGTAGFSGDGGPATSAELDLPHGVAFTSSGTLLIADALNNRIRAVSTDGTISTVVGTGATGFSGDGGSATEATLSAPHGVTAVPGGGFLIPDTDNERVRFVWPDGTITTVAGTGTAGFSGDGGPATSAQLSRPFAAVPTADGGFLIADTGNDRIREVARDGTITTVAGDGVRGFGGDDGLATEAALSSPHNLAVLPDGGFLIADEGNNRMRRVWPDGTITTVAGTGAAGSSGDGGPAGDAQLNEPKEVTVLPDLQGFLVADAANSRIRLVSMDLRRVLLLRLATQLLHARAGSQVRLAFDLSDPAAVRLEVRAGRRVVARVTVKARQGRNTLRFGRGLRPGRYAVVLVAASALDRPAQATASLQITAR